jgi:hypothetical protein
MVSARDRFLTPAKAPHARGSTCFLRGIYKQVYSLQPPRLRGPVPQGEQYCLLMRQFYGRQTDGQLVKALAAKTHAEIERHVCAGYLAGLPDGSAVVRNHRLRGARHRTALI